MKQADNKFAPVEVPDGALYGAETVRCLQNLSCSPFKMSACPELIEGLAAVKKAAALANRAAGVIDDSICQRICAACDQVIGHRHDREFPVDMLHGGGSIAFNQNMNEVLASLASAGEDSDVAVCVLDAKVHVNASQSTADSCATAFRLAILIAAADLQAALSAVIDCLESKSTHYALQLTVARTCLQDAMPVPIASMFTAWSAGLQRRKERLSETVGRLKRVNLGGTVIGSGQGAPLAYREQVVQFLALVTGKPFVLRDNLYDAAQNADDLGEVSSALCQLAEMLIKVCADLRLLSSGPQFGFSELKLPAVQNGSSFFANKNNPVVPETVLQACFHVLGNHRAGQAALEHAELNLNVFESGLFFHTIQSISILRSALVLLNDRCLRDLTVNEQLCADMVKRHAQKQQLETKEISES